MMGGQRQDVVRLSQLMSAHDAIARHNDREISGLCLDSRRVKPGDCFIALNGADSHGAQFISDAVAAGASVVLVEDAEVANIGSVPVISVANLRRKLGFIANRYFGEPSASLDVIAVTGTNGKTTVAQLCAHALRHLRGSAAYAGTLGYGLIGELTEAANTTPDAITLHAMLAELRDQACAAFALEVSSHAIVQARVVGIAIDVAVFTNIGHDHLDYHESHEAYAQVKKSLFHDESVKQAVVNLDDDVGRELVEELHGIRPCWTFSTDDTVVAPDGGRHLSLENYEGNRRGSYLTVRAPTQRIEFTTALIGKFNAQNVLASLAALMALGVDADAAATALAHAPSVPGRMQVLEPGAIGAPMVVVDYAHSPDSLACVLAALRELTSSRLFCVFGCGGDRDKSKRGMMGSVAERMADVVIITSDNPRSEDNKSIAASILLEVNTPEKVQVIHDRGEAIATSILAAGVGDTVLIAGKGHENYQEIGIEKFPFSDVAHASDVLQQVRA